MQGVPQVVYVQGVPQGGRREGGYPTTLPLYHGGYIPPCVHTTLYIPGYTMVTVLSVHHLPVTLRCRLTHRGAHLRRNPWVGGLYAPLVFKGVTVVMPLCAECSPLSREN